MVSDLSIGRRLNDGSLNSAGDPSNFRYGGRYVDEAGLPNSIFDWPPDQPSVKAVYLRPDTYDEEGRITAITEVLLPSTPNKHAKYVAKGFIRLRYVDPRARGVDVLPRFNSGQNARVKPRLETLAEYQRRREMQQMRLQADKEAYERALGVQEETEDEVEIAVEDEVAESVAETDRLAELERELEVARKTLADVLAKQSTSEQPASEPESQPTTVDVATEAEMTPAQLRMAKARAARGKKKAAA